MFELAGDLAFDLCAPALHESLYYAHFDTVRNTRCLARRCGFVEIMAPCFSVGALEKLLPTLDLMPTGWGRGARLAVAEAAGLSQRRHHRGDAGAAHPAGRHVP
jgi:hypothetical protein